MGGKPCEIIEVIENVISYNPPAISDLTDYTKPQQIVVGIFQGNMLCAILHYSRGVNQV